MLYRRPGDLPRPLRRATRRTPHGRPKCHRFRDAQRLPGTQAVFARKMVPSPQIFHRNIEAVCHHATSCVAALRATYRWGRFRATEATVQSERPTRHLLRNRLARLQPVRLGELAHLHACGVASAIASSDSPALHSVKTPACALLLRDGLETLRGRQLFASLPGCAGRRRDFPTASSSAAGWGSAPPSRAGKRSSHRRPGADRSHSRLFTVSHTMGASGTTLSKPVLHAGFFAIMIAARIFGTYSLVSFGSILRR